jgi:hypothetical protein
MDVDGTWSFIHQEVPFLPITFNHNILPHPLSNKKLALAQTTHPFPLPPHDTTTFKLTSSILKRVSNSKLS